MDAFTPGTAVASAAGACPYVDRGDAKCARRFTLDRIDEAFTVCFGAHHGCENFHRLRHQELARDEEVAGRERRAPTILTIAGHAHSEPGRVRPTGT